MTPDLATFLHALAPVGVAGILALAWRWQYRRHHRSWAEVAVGEHLAELRRAGRCG